MTARLLPHGNKDAIPIGNLPLGTIAYDWRVPHHTNEEATASAHEAYMSELLARRRERLKQWINSVGGQKEALEILGKPQSLVSRISTATNPKPIGEALARAIEQRAGLPFGWLDAEDEETKNKSRIPQDSLTKRLLTLWVQLPYAGKNELVGMAAGMLRRTGHAA